MTSEKRCIFNRSSKCIYKGGFCDHDCEKGNWEGGGRSYEDLLGECLGKGERKLFSSKKFLSLLLP